MLTALRARVTALPRRKVVAAVVITALVCGAGVWYWVRSLDKYAYCATVSDATGLYKDAAVTIRGMDVGRVSSISPRGAGVRLGLRLDRGDIADTVKVAVVNNAVINDRHVELVGALDPRQGKWTAGQCISGQVPVSVNNALKSMNDMVQSLAKPDATGQSPLSTLLHITGSQLGDRGPQIRQTLDQLSRAVDQPDQFIAQLRVVLTQIGPLMDLANRNIGVLEPIQSQLIGTIKVVGQVFGVAADLVTNIGSLLVVLYQKMLPDWFPKYVRPGVEQAMPSVLAALDSIKQHRNDIQAALSGLPGFFTALQGMLVTTPGAITLGIDPPKVALTSVQAAALCGAAGPAAARLCGGPPQPGLPVVQLVMAAMSGHQNASAPAPVRGGGR
ncbi:MlaD family protein [Jongsikchunia kroppenstedtii]|uniref:MlaD family protein n=1 Tax=Jongsikchunia kroppenstedtii TaxID=1121721 RepID=UPI0003632BC7|nr:MlaD family protein [Jongsikchunia kroppenstedtii]